MPGALSARLGGGTRLRDVRAGLIEAVAVSGRPARRSPRRISSPAVAVPGGPRPAEAVVVAGGPQPAAEVAAAAGDSPLAEAAAVAGSRPAAVAVAAG